jgi:hypothetical protein
MAIYAIGAVFGDAGDVSEDFISGGLACLGWDATDAPYLHQLFRRITVGDLITIKSYAPQQGLFLKAVGMVTKPNYLSGMHPTLGESIGVDWVWHPGSGLSHHVGLMKDKADHMRRGALYEELNPRLQKLITDLFLGRHPLEVVGSVAEAAEAA